MKDSASKPSNEKRRDAPVYTSLMKAAAQGDEDTIVYLLDVAVGTSNEQGGARMSQNLPSGAAEENIDGEQSHWAEEEPVDLFMKDRRGRTALDWARLGRHSQCAHLLEQAMAAEIEKKRKENEK